MEKVCFDGLNWLDVRYFGLGDNVLWQQFQASQSHVCLGNRQHTSVNELTRSFPPLRFDSRMSESALEIRSGSDPWVGKVLQKKKRGRRGEAWARSPGSILGSDLSNTAFRRALGLLFLRGEASGVFSA